MRGMRSTALIFFLMAVACLIQPREILSQEKPKLKISVSTEKNVYYLGEEVQLTVLIRNFSDEAIDVIEPAIDRRSLNIEIIQPSGLSDRMLAIYGLKLETVRLGAKRRIRFNTAFTPEQLGKFTIKVTYFGHGDDMMTADPKNIFIVQKPL